MNLAAILADAGKAAAGGVFENVTGIPTGGGTRNISSSVSSNAITVNPAITVIGGSGSANPSTSGGATSSPSTPITANNPWQPYGSGYRAPAQAEVDVSTWQGGGAPASSDLIAGIPNEWLMAGAGIAAALYFGG